MKRANLLSNKEKGYLLSPEYRQQVKHTNITPHTTKNKAQGLSGRNGSMPDMRIQEDHPFELGAITEQNTDMEFYKEEYKNL